MRVKISRVAKNNGLPRAFTVKVNGKIQAINLAIMDFEDSIDR